MAVAAIATSQAKEVISQWLELKCFEHMKGERQAAVSSQVLVGDAETIRPVRAGFFSALFFVVS